MAPPRTAPQAGGLKHWNGIHRGRGGAGTLIQGRGVAELPGSGIAADAGCIRRRQPSRSQSHGAGRPHHLSDRADLCRRQLLGVPPRSDRPHSWRRLAMSSSAPPAARRPVPSLPAGPAQRLTTAPKLTRSLSSPWIWVLDKIHIYRVERSGGKRVASWPREVERNGSLP